ncbi:unnamed protein product [Fraxinus pennsylvanica]|uniref:SPX domain-containing protein n=1 Tax=Fraxinus pennsylvanica TaxID=56036 RepID=A0AAD1YRE3_9LAMI|nr:unnamed protein product [Fraxinus pennsylvanica]
MKFGKEFEKQKVPEWTKAYVVYNRLKRILQEIRRIKQSNLPPAPLRDSQQRSIRCRTINGLNLEACNIQNPEDIEKPVITVDTIESYTTPVNTFYKDKVEEVAREAALLNTQMDALIALRIKVMNLGFHGSSSLRRLSTDIDNLPPSKVTSPKRAKTNNSSF